jgi:methyltransferase (TIGR00027 family)
MNPSITKVGKTAFIIAQWRVFETESVSPLFSDHIAHIFLDKETQRMTGALTQVSPSTRHLIGFRTRYIDERLMQAIDAGVRQIVLLGAGLDTRPLRFMRPGVRFFEVDQADVLAFKRARLAAYGYELSSTTIACDYIAEDWIAHLIGAGFDPRQPAYVIWEGNSMYIPEPQIRRLLGAMRDRLASFTLSFDYLSRKLIAKTAQPQSRRLVAGFQELEAPWITGFADISELARAAGLRLADNWLLVEFGKQHRPWLCLDARLLDDYFICSFSS